MAHHFVFIPVFPPRIDKVLGALIDFTALLSVRLSRKVTTAQKCNRTFNGGIHRRIAHFLHKYDKERVHFRVKGIRNCAGKCSSAI